MPHLLVGVLEVVGEQDQELIVLTEEEQVVTKALDDDLQAEAHLQTVDCRPVVHVLQLEDLEYFTLLAVVDQGLEALVCLLGNELVCVGTLFEEDLDNRVQAWFHYSFQGMEHVTESDQGNSRDG